MKKCRKCGAEDRLPSGDCRPCSHVRKREYLHKNSERIKLLRKVWRAKNASRILENENKKRALEGRPARKSQKDKSCIKCGSTKRYKNGCCAPCTVVRNKEYREKNADKVLDIQRRYILKNADKVRRQRQNRRARLSGAGVLSDGICERLHVGQRGYCACCGTPLGVDYELDHIMPLALGGLNVDANMQLLTARCNGRKLAKHPEQYAKERGFSYWPPRDWLSVTRTSAQIKSPAC